jgi:L-methionine (R)-S-oxide reductase
MKQPVNMAESINMEPHLGKEEKYRSLLPQIEVLISGERDFVANLSNIMAALKYGMGFFWVGVYQVKAGELVLGPFQGPVACTRIPFGKGVCGTCYIRKEPILVADVEQFPGHIACSSEARSEIVLPVIKDGEVVMVLDVDSDRLNDFDAIDQRYLQQVSELIAKIL